MASMIPTVTIFFTYPIIIVTNVHLRRRFIEGIDHTESHRENLRQMLLHLRKDAMDEDLEKSDGDYFPCEFCGDPYPVEFIMRHQVSVNDA